MHLFYCIVAALIVLAVGCFLLAVTSKVQDPEDDRDFHEKVIDMDARLQWEKDFMKKVK